MKEDKGYNHLKDPQIKRLAFNIGVFLFIVVASGKTVEFIIDKYVVGEPNVAADLAKTN